MNIFKRPFWVCLHRWAGLTIAGFLILTGLPGSILAFYPELERQINPQFYVEQTNSNKLDIVTLAERVQQQILGEVHRPVAMWLIRERNVYQYSVRSSRDIQDRRGGTSVFFDADTGAFKLLLLPTGQYNGNTVTSWLYALHMGNVFGLPYRIFVCITSLICRYVIGNGDSYLVEKTPR